MTTLCQQRSDGGQRACQKPGARVLQTHVTNCTPKLNGHFHEGRKIVCNNFPEAAQERVIELIFYAEQALPLRNRRIPRLAQISPMAVRSPARRQRDDRAMSGKIAGKMSRGIASQWPDSGNGNAAECPSRWLARQLALGRTWPRNVHTGNLRDDSQLGRATTTQLPGNGRSVAAAMPTSVRQDDLQDSLPSAGRGRAKSVPQSARWPAQHLASDLSDSRRQLFSHDIQKL
jgi:hypothetical protein